MNLICAHTKFMEIEKTRRAWLGVVSAEHVARGVDLGIAQVNHGKRGPLARMKAGDVLVYYSPTVKRGVPDGYRSFTALGTFPDDDIWQADEGTFTPFRRRIDYQVGRHVPVDEVRSQLALTAAPHWGHQLRFGLIELEPADAEVIRRAMGS